MKLRTLAVVSLVAILLSTATGCMYPNEMRAENQVSYREATMLVQEAVAAYQKDKGILPIITSPPETPVYEKYRIQFEPLIQGNYLSAIPSAAYEQGGLGYFIIIHEETNPQVKLMDLATFQQVNDAQKLVDTYRSSHAGELPKGDELYPQFFKLNESQLKGKLPAVKSVFSGNPVQLMMNQQGKVYVDYAADLMIAIEKAGSKPIDAKQDLREILVAASFYVPVKSTVYHWLNEQPVPVNV